MRTHGKDTKLARVQARRDQTDQGRDNVERCCEWTSGRRDDAGKKGAKGASLIGTMPRIKKALGGRRVATARARAKSDIVEAHRFELSRSGPTAQT